mgnify:CR=1 FL=1
MKRFITKKLVALGLSASAALSAGYLIVPWEGSVKNKKGEHVAYIDAVGVPTACYGQTVRDLYGKTIRKGMIYSEKECLIMLEKSVKHFESVVDRNVRVPYASPYQKSALISFNYNLGEGNLRSSTLLRQLNAGQHEAACEQLIRWVYAKKKKLKGLVDRRSEEMLWCMGDVPYEVEITFSEITEMVRDLNKDPL